MSDPLNLLPAKKSSRFEVPDSPGSVGWTFPQRVQLADATNPLPLEGGGSLAPVEVEYETYGQLNQDASNAILILHALSGDAHVAGWDASAREYGRPWRLDRPGWWDSMVGPGKAFDTRKYFVICSNVLGGCYGTTGPGSVDPATGRPYGLRFPVVTVGDWVRLQERLVSHLGIERLWAVAGGSLGGQQALEWALAYPERVQKVIILASSARLSDQGIAFNQVARQAIINDPGFRGGDYYGERGPERGLAIARMLGHITYLSETSMGWKFGRRYCHKGGPSFGFNLDFEVERYLEHQGRSFVERFDANSYLYITKAMDYYDAASWGEGDLVRACIRAKSQFLLLSFSSDWLYPPAQTKQLARAIKKAGKSVIYFNLASLYGHDAFLLEANKVTPIIKRFLEA
ncbi:MAG: homoserine O-acetyltransferase [Clostridia bacterium]|nr:homoserine O-acetyltransferase [Clostridia bacterium]